MPVVIRNWVSICCLILGLLACIRLGISASNSTLSLGSWSGLLREFALPVHLLAVALFVRSGSHAPRWRWIIWVLVVASGCGLGLALAWRLLGGQST